MPNEETTLQELGKALAARDAAEYERNEARREADQLRQALTVAHGQRERWKSGFMVEAARAESGKQLMNDIARLVREADGSCNDGQLMAQLMMDIGGTFAVFMGRYDKAPKLPSALELLDDNTRATLELEGLKLLLEQMREAIDEQRAADDDVANHPRLIPIEDDDLVTIEVPARLLRTLATVLEY